MLDSEWYALSLERIILLMKAAKFEMLLDTTNEVNSNLCHRLTRI